MPSNLKEQVVLEEAVSNSYCGKVIVRNFEDSIFPRLLGWQKYLYSIYVHYIGNRLFPRCYQFSP